MRYYTWLRGNNCCQPINNCGCSGKNVCDCQEILLEISKLHTDDEILQEEIDDLSGVVETKQDILSAGTGIDITNNVISATGGGGSVTVDSELSLVSTNPVQNKVVTEALNGKLDASAYTPTDLSNYYTKEEVNSAITEVENEIPSLSGYATEQWVLNQNYVTKSELIQHITNLQEQINSLVSVISGCCGESGETQYRWVTMTGENDYWCSGTTKYSKEKEQSSIDGINWTDTGNIRSGSTILEENCVECGYVESGSSILQMSYSSTTNPTNIANICSSNVEHISVAATPHSYTYTGCRTDIPIELAVSNIVNIYKSTNTVENGEYANTDLYNIGMSSEITSIGNGAFSGNTKLISASIGNFSRLNPTSQEPVSNLTSIGDYAFSGCTNLTAFTISHQDVVPSLGTGVFDGCNLQTIYVKNSAVNTFKSAWPQYSSIIVGI